MQRGEAAKVYNLSSAGKALPGWLSAKRRRSLQRESAAGRLEVVQNLQFPTACARVKVSADGETLMATGAYPPQLRAYELRELSMKYQYHFVSDVVQFQILSPDWKKAVFLLSDRTLQFHSQFGKHHATRIPHFGRALAYQRETCELLVGGAGPELFRLSLERGSHLSPLQCGCAGVAALGVHPAHGMLAVGTTDGTVQCWDPRQRRMLGSCRPFDAVDDASGAAGAAAAAAAAAAAPALEVSALRFDPRGLQLAAGTSTGQVVVYDIRRAAPLRVKDHMCKLRPGPTARGSRSQAPASPAQVRPADRRPQVPRRGGAAHHLHGREGDPGVGGGDRGGAHVHRAAR